MLLCLLMFFFDSIRTEMKWSCGWIQWVRITTDRRPTPTSPCPSVLDRRTASAIIMRHWERRCKESSWSSVVWASITMVRHLYKLCSFRKAWCKCCDESGGISIIVNWFYVHIFLSPGMWFQSGYFAHVTPPLCIGLVMPSNVVPWGPHLEKTKHRWHRL